jgi:pimeloyl-ACP methyl ester carboxylesterase
MSFITTADGTRIFYKDWGTGRPVLFSHGWPPMVFASSPMTAAATAAPTSPARAMTWTPMPTTSRR